MKEIILDVKVFVIKVESDDANFSESYGSQENLEVCKLKLVKNQNSNRCTIKIQDGRTDIYKASQVLNRYCTYTAVSHTLHLLDISPRFPHERYTRYYLDFKGSDIRKIQNILIEKIEELDSVLTYVNYATLWENSTLPFLHTLLDTLDEFEFPEVINEIIVSYLQVQIWDIGGIVKSADAQNSFWMFDHASGSVSQLRSRSGQYLWEPSGWRPRVDMVGCIHHVYLTEDQTESDKRLLQNERLMYIELENSGNICCCMESAVKYPFQEDALQILQEFRSLEALSSLL